LYHIDTPSPFLASSSDWKDITAFFNGLLLQDSPGE